MKIKILGTGCARCHELEKTVREVVAELKLDATIEEVKDRVPPDVFKTQKEYVECPSCHRIYWKGTHWQAMNEKLARLTGE